MQLIHLCNLYSGKYGTPNTLVLKGEHPVSVCGANVSVCVSKGELGVPWVTFFLALLKIGWYAMHDNYMCYIHL